MKQENTIVLHVYRNMLEAKMAQDLLNEKGIESMLNDENVMGLDPVGGTELRVFEKDKEKAGQVIGESA